MTIWTAWEAPGRHQGGRKGLIGQPARHQGGTREAGKDQLDSLRGTRKAGKGLIGPGGTREAGNDHLDSLGGTKETPGMQEGYHLKHQNPSLTLRTLKTSLVPQNKPLRGAQWRKP